MNKNNGEPVILPLADCKIVALAWDVTEHDFSITVLEPFSHVRQVITCRWHNGLDINLHYLTDYGGMPLIAQAELLRQEGWLLLTIDCKGFPDGLLKLRCQELQLGQTLYTVEEENGE